MIFYIQLRDLLHFLGYTERKNNFMGISVSRKTSKYSLDSYKSKNPKIHSGLCCLTKLVEKFFSQYALSKFIPWCVDTSLFDGISIDQNPEKPFFLASGKTGRDYKTLVNAATLTLADIRIIGPKKDKPSVIPQNVKWFDSSLNPPDKAIDYPTKKWYAECVAVCIPLSGEAETLVDIRICLKPAMRKPVIMTKLAAYISTLKWIILVI